VYSTVEWSLDGGTTWFPLRGYEVSLCTHLVTGLATSIMLRDRDTESNIISAPREWKLCGVASPS